MGWLLLSVDQGLWGLYLEDEVCIPPPPSYLSFPRWVPVQPLFHLLSSQPVYVKLLEKVTWVVIPEGRVQRPILHEEQIRIPFFPISFP